MTLDREITEAVLAADDILTGPDLDTLIADYVARMPPGRADQFDAAHREASAGAQRETPLMDQPEWVRLGVLSAMMVQVSDQARTCLHNPDPDRPEPIHTAAWTPGLGVCSGCTDLLAPPADGTCDGCGNSAVAHVYVVVFGRFSYRARVCADCAY